MALMSKAEAEAQLITVNTAIENLLSGKNLTQLRIGSGDFARLYTYQEINLETLKEYRAELLQIIADNSPADVTFKTNMHIPMIVRKGV